MKPSLTLTARIADITTLDVDAIVNAANDRLTHGSGVCGAIHRAAGPELVIACEAIGRCPTGEARITPGFRLLAKFVIHAVGPVWKGGEAGEAALLSATYRNALSLARDAGCTTVAFPAISTGIYGYPLQDATRVAVQAARDFETEAGGLQEVVFACFNQAALRAYQVERVVLSPPAMKG